MGAPRLAPETERKRRHVVDELDKPRLRDAACLEQVALAASTVVGTPMAHVSLMRSEKQRVVARCGAQEMPREISRDDSFCAYTLAENEIMVVEDATDDPRFQDNPLVKGKQGGLRFYVGLPVLVDDVPVGTLCLTDGEPGTLEHQQRVELFGLLHAVESYLEVSHEHGFESDEQRIAAHMTEARASTVRARFEDDLNRRAEQAILNAERQLKEAAEVLEPGSALSAPDTKPDTTRGAPGLGYQDTDPADEEP